MPSTLSSRILLGLTLLTILIMGFLLAWHSLGGLDIWMHEHIGQEILAGKFPGGTNSYSYTEPQHHWTNHEWLFQVLVAALGPRSGQPLEMGIFPWNLLRTLLVLALLGIILLRGGHLDRLRGRQEISGYLTWLGLPLLLGLLLLWTRLLLRPELISYIFLVCLVGVLEQPALVRPARAGTRRIVSWLDPRQPLVQAVVLTLVWAQFHGFSAMAPVLFLVAALGRWAQPRLGYQTSQEIKDPSPLSWKEVLLGSGLLLLALLLSPSGLQGLLYPLRALGQFGQDEVNLQTSISELVPLLETQNSLQATLLGFKLSLAWGLVWIIMTWTRISLLRVLVWGIAAVAALSAQRNLGLYAVTFLLLHQGAPTSPLWQRYVAPRIRIPAKSVPLIGLVITVILSAWWAGQIVRDDFYLAEGVGRRFGAGQNPGRFPVESSEYLKVIAAQRVFTNVDAAAFLLNQTGAAVFIDGRTEAYSARHWARYAQLRQGGTAALEAIQSGRPDGVFLATGGGAFNQLARSILQSPRWNLQLIEPAGLLFTSAPAADLNPANLLAAKLPRSDKGAHSTRLADLCLSWSTDMGILDRSDLQERALRRGLEFKPDHPNLLHNLGNLQLARDDLDEAFLSFTAALKKNGRLAGSALNAGVCKMRLGKPAEAADWFQKAVEIDGNSFQGWANLATARLALQQTAAARSALEQASGLRPQDRRIKEMLRQLPH